MKTLIVTALIAASFVAGSTVEYHTRTVKVYRQLSYAEHRLQRFSNPAVIRHAQKVADLTGTPLSQVLTGRKGE